MQTTSKAKRKGENESICRSDIIDGLLFQLVTIHEGTMLVRNIENQQRIINKTNVYAWELN